MSTNATGCTEWERDFDPVTEQPKQVQCSCIASCNEIVPIDQGCRGLRKPVDVHAYRKAIADDCVVGYCSINNCLYPTCSRAYIEARSKANDSVLELRPKPAEYGVIKKDLGT